MNKILTCLLLFLCFSLHAQLEINGKIVDKKTQGPLEFAEVILLSGADTDLIGTISDADGSFLLKADAATYTLQVIYLGQILYTQDLALSANMDLGTIETDNVIQLDDVTVTARKKLIERQIDRLVFNVESSTKASRGDALEVLKVTPGVRVQNDQINMIGKSALAVMIDDKIVNLSNQELTNYLKSIPSENIKSIEVITTPPAKYEAAGNSGLINIILKEAKQDSWNAQFRASARQNTYPSGTLGGSFNFNKNKFSLASSIFYRDGTYYQEQDDYAYFPDGLWYTSSPFKAGISGLNGRVDLNYEVTSKWSMGAQYFYNVTNFAVTDSPYTPVFDNTTDEILRSLQSDGTMDLKPEIHSVNFNNEFELDTLGRNMAINLDYFTYKNPDVKTYNGVSVIQNPFSKQFYRGTNTNNQNVDNFSAKLDFEVPTDWINLSFGGKATFSKSVNEILSFNSGLVDDPVTELPINQNDFEYDEDIQAVYFSADKELNDKWSVQAGLRMEATQTNSFSETLNLDRKNDYLKFFPTLYFAYSASEDSDFSINYSRRIQRPSFSQVNPNIYFINPFQTIEGNAFLQPAFIDNVELSNTYKNFATKLYYSFEDNLFSQVPLPNVTTNVIRFTNENFIDAQRFGFSEEFTFEKWEWWSSSNSFDINYMIARFDLSEKQADQKGISSSVSTYNDFSLNSAGTFMLGVNFWYSFPGVSGIFNNLSASSFSLSLQHSFFEKKLNVSINANDLFKDEAERTTATVNGVFQEARYYYDSRYVMLSISYSLGNGNIRAKRHNTGNQEEKGRAR